MKPSPRDLATALHLVGELLGVERADYCFEGRFRFALGAGWSLVVSADDAERFRLQACYRSRPQRTLWTLAADRARLAALVVAAKREVLALAV